MNNPPSPPSPSPTVWYIAAGYKLPAGIEAYLLHYATELRHQGFDPRIIVFEPLPKVPHRFLVALRERGIPIESLYEKVASRARLLTLSTFLPWAGKRIIDYWLLVIRGKKSKEAVGCSGSDESGKTNNQQLITDNYTSLLTYWRKRLAVQELKRMLEREKPDIIHVKGRLITEAWSVFPPECTIYQHALMGTRDPSWEDYEAEAFSRFLNRIARVLVQGKGIAETFALSFNIKRSIDVVYTMAPDEIRGQGTVGREQWTVGREQWAVGREQRAEGRGQWAEGSGAGVERRGPSSSAVSSLPTASCQLSTVRSLRFGILCRFTEQKGITYILEALELFKEKYGAIDFTFAGQGPMEEEIREAVGGGQRAVDSGQGAKEKSIEQKPTKITEVGNCFSAGCEAETNPLRASCASVQNSFLKDCAGVHIVPVTTAVDILKNLDVFVHPGLDDAMPVSIVEALMCGVPCIVSDVGASPELVRDGVEGMVIKPASAEQILVAMERFAQMTESELEQFKQRARQRYEESCRPEVVGTQVAAIYRGVMGDVKSFIRD